MRKCVWKKVRGGQQPAGVRPKTANGFVQDNVLQYWVLGRREFFDAKRISVSVDGLRISGEDILMFAIADQRTGMCMWSAPQAFSRGLPITITFTRNSWIFETTKTLSFFVLSILREIRHSSFVKVKAIVKPLVSVCQNKAKHSTTIPKLPNSGTRLFVCFAGGVRKLRVHPGFWVHVTAVVVS
jgi:hypothetical protein